jgi:hypothetical protein
VSRRRRVQGWLLTRDLSISGASVLFSLWVTFAAGYAAVYQAMVIVLAGIILYAFLKARRERLGQAIAPVDNMPETSPDGVVVLGVSGTRRTGTGNGSSITTTRPGTGRDENAEAGR